MYESPKGQGSKMKIPEQKQKKWLRPKTIIILALLLLLLISGAFLVYNKYYAPQDAPTTRPNNTVDYNPPTEAEKKEALEKKKEIIEGDNPPATTPTAPSSPSTPAPTKKDTGVVISQASQNSDGGPLEIKAFATQKEETGTCTVTLTKAGATTVTKQASSAILSSYNVCQGFTINASEFSTAGDWSLQLQFESTNYKGSVTQTVTIKK